MGDSIWSLSLFPEWRGVMWWLISTLLHWERPRRAAELKGACPLLPCFLLGFSSLQLGSNYCAQGPHCVEQHRTHRDDVKYEGREKQYRRGCECLRYGRCLLFIQISVSQEFASPAAGHFTLYPGQFLSVWYKLESSGKKEPQLRKSLYSPSSLSLDSSSSLFSLPISPAYPSTA